MKFFSFFKKKKQPIPEAPKPKKVGLSLGSGSMRGLAHIGVIEVLLENEIPIDMVAGCSMGAIIGGIFSAGTDMTNLEKYVCSMKMMEHIDLSVPLKGGFIQGDKLEELIRLFTHEFTFSQTRNPFYCVAVDINEGALKVFEEGPLHKAIRASMSIPGIFIPTEIDGHTYVDGGVIQRVPNGVLKEKGADIIIAVDVGYRGTPFGPGKISPLSALNRSIDMMQWEALKGQTGADITIVPDVRFVKGRFDISQAQKIIEQGRKAALEKIESIKELLHPTNTGP